MNKTHLFWHWRTVTTARPFWPPATEKVSPFQNIPLFSLPLSPLCLNTGHPMSLAYTFFPNTCATVTYCIYQHSLSRDWAVFLIPGRLTPDGMPHSINYTICFSTHHHRIDVANLTKCCNATQIFVMVMPERYSPQKAAFSYRLLTALRLGKKDIFHLQIWKSMEHSA